ncbi:MerR family transcriptional regulator [candidate division KSB1 bacterium]|nr:MerR family transcriptional regulator [candidate division KSB1 bacterium]
MLIGELASKTGFSRDTIRYYETLGLIRPDFRRESRYREYSDMAVSTLMFIRNVKDLGFTLSEIKEMIEAFNDAAYSCETAAVVAASKIRKIDQKIEELKAFKISLGKLIDTCAHNSPAELCAAFEALWRE